MAKLKATVTAGDRGTLKIGEATGDPSRKWASSPGMYIAGRAYLDEADHTAASMEAKWGAGRLRLLVSPELREKFDRQRYLLNQAIWHGQDLEQVKREAMRMVKAWLALDKDAALNGQGRLHSAVWEIALADGTVAAIVPDGASAGLVEASGRAVSIYTLEEIARLLHGYPGLAKIKNAFPGATITAVRRTVDDPLDGLDDSRRPLDAPIADDEIPW